MRTQPELDPHLAWLRGFCSRVLYQDPHGAEDLYQDTLVAALEYPLDPSRSPRPWLSRVARNFAYQRLRRRQREAALCRGRDPHPEAPATDEVCASREELAWVLASLERIAASNAEVMHMRYREGLLPLEIARRLKLPHTTVRSRLKRGLRQLRQRAHSA